MPGTTPQLSDYIVRAGAGAGKTTGLVAKVVEVFRQFQQVGETPRIVVTTFTRKATQELKERLIEKACKEEDPRLLQFVTDPGRLSITTIHGLLNVFMRQVGHLAGLDAGFQLVGEGEGRHIARMALRETLLADPDGMSVLEVYGFKRALEMCRRYEMASRENSGLKPATIEDIHRAVAAQVEIWGRDISELASSILEEVDDPKWITVGKNLRQFVESWGGSAQEIEDLSHLFKKHNRNNKNPTPFEHWHDRFDSVIKPFKEEMKKECWNQDLWPKMVTAWQQFAPLAERYIEQVSKLKESQARFELSDLELKSIEMLRSHPHLGVIFSDNWDFWMIDEYQDTSPLQVACLKALIAGKPTYFVGDPQQSIYLFRGAEVKVFDEAEVEVTGRGGQALQLRRNYRSRPELLRWINDFMASVSGEFAPMDTREEELDSKRTCVSLLRASDSEQELDAVVARIEQLLEKGARLDQICVLGRTHRTLMDVSRRLRECGFPTHVHSARGFNVRREVIDAQALWKFLVNPHDNLNLMILLRSPWFFIADSQLREWMSSRPQSLWTKLQALGEKVPDAIARLRAAKSAVPQKGLARTFEDTLCSAAYLDLSLVNDPAGRKESNLWKLIHRAREMEKEGGASILDFVSGEAGGDPLDVSEGDATSAQEPNSINLMTIHGAKGLEFDHVIIPRMGERPLTSHTPPLEAEDGAFFFPLWDEENAAFTASPLDYLKTRKQKQKELAEFDRWLYVALTRAKTSLTLSWSSIEGNSWAARSPWFLKAAGLHATEHYSFEITEECNRPNGYLHAAKSLKVRERFSEVTEGLDERLAVSDLVSQNVRPVKQQDLIKSWQARTLGTRIHRALEALKYGGEVSEDLREASEYVLSIQSPPMAALIQEGEVEWGFQVLTKSGVIPGQIDLWAKHDGKIYIVDYKSGSTAFKDQAFEQLGIYAWALRKFGHDEPIELVVVYPLNQKVETQKFDDKLFSSWELKFSSPEA